MDNTYCFAVNLTLLQTIRESSLIDWVTVSRGIIANRFPFCREVSQLIFVNRSSGYVAFRSRSRSGLF